MLPKALYATTATFQAAALLRLKNNAPKQKNATTIFKHNGQSRKHKYLPRKACLGKKYAQVWPKPILYKGNVSGNKQICHKGLNRDITNQICALWAPSSFKLDCNTENNEMKKIFFPFCIVWIKKKNFYWNQIKVAGYMYAHTHTHQSLYYLHIQLHVHA